MRISDWSSDVCSSDLAFTFVPAGFHPLAPRLSCWFRLRHERLIEWTKSPRSRLWAFPLALILCGSWRTVALSAQRKLRSMQRASLPTFPWLTTTRKRRHSTSFPPLSKRCFRPFLPRFGNVLTSGGLGGGKKKRSEEHTSELQSLMRNSYADFCLKKKKKNISKADLITDKIPKKYNSHKTLTNRKIYEPKTTD